MNRLLFIVCGLFFLAPTFAQVGETQDQTTDPNSIKQVTGDLFEQVKRNSCTPIKDQERTNTCWSFSTTSLIESQSIKNKIGVLDLSEMFTVRNIYIEKAKNYILRQGNTQFSEGGLGHDVIRSVATYGAVPENAYTGHTNGNNVYDHGAMFRELKKYLDSTLKTGKLRPLTGNWLNGYQLILDKHMGIAVDQFTYNGKRHNPLSFAKGVLKFNPDDYINLTSFTHHPFYQSFILEVPDNFSNGAYYNLPIQELIESVKTALTNGYTVLWDADVSNNGFDGKSGLALLIAPTENSGKLSIDAKELSWNQQNRQELFENLTTQDDHLMHIVGMEKSKDGKTFFIVKNSWGAIGPFGGYIHVSESYFAMNTISIVLPKAALTQIVLDKLKK